MRNGGWFLLVLITTACSTGGAGDRGESDVVDSEVPAEVGGTVTMSNLLVPVGMTVTITSDVTFEVAGWTAIAGSIVGDGLGPWSIVIESGGRVEVTGTVAAGAAKTGGAGGSITLESAASDIVLGATARIVAGDGGPGLLDAGSFGAGGDGGSVTLLAEAGVLRVGAGATITLGDGGSGADLSVLEADVGAASVLSPGNSGGDGGPLLIEAGSAEGIAFETLTATRAWPPHTASVLTPSGARYTTGVDSAVVLGGAGGTGGALVFGDEEASSNWPPGLRLPASGPGKYNDCAALLTDPLVDRCVHGGDGGGGNPAGAGGPARVIGKSGAAPGARGEGVVGIGGTGGTCREHGVGCVPGTGGASEARGGAGAAALAPGLAGGDGGLAEASAGDSGLPWPLTATVPPLTCANAKAEGGNGAKGGGRCEGPLGETGGTGGTGGEAAAYSGVYILRLWTETLEADERAALEALTCAPGTGVADASASNGGDGGDALSAPGGAGGGGAAFLGLDADAAAPGAPGQPGAFCDAPTGCESNAGCEDGDDCTLDQCEDKQCFHVPIEGCAVLGVCALVDGVCTGDEACPEGTHCDASCAACVAGCRAADCTDDCPLGLACSGACDSCVASYAGGGGGVVVITGAECQLDADTEACQDACPDGLGCNPTCSACVKTSPSPQGCSKDDAGECTGDCPAGSTCDAAECVCVSETIGQLGACTQALITVADGLPTPICVDKCPDGFACDSECSGCSPVGCFVGGASGTCVDHCPAGMHCDATCDGCIPATEGCTPDSCASPNCPPGVACNPDCTACEIGAPPVPTTGCAFVPGEPPVVAGAGDVLICLGGCADGEYCGPECACQPEPAIGTPGGPEQKGACSSILDALGVVVGCEDHCGYAAKCGADCQQCAPCDPDTEPGCPKAPTPCQAETDPSSGQLIGCTDGCPGDLKCDGSCSSCVECTDDGDCSCATPCLAAACVEGSCECTPKALGSPCGDGSTCAEKGCGVPLTAKQCTIEIPKGGAVDLGEEVTPEPGGILLETAKALLAAEYSLAEKTLGYESSIAGQQAIGLVFEAVSGDQHNARARAVGQGSASVPPLQSFAPVGGLGGTFGAPIEATLGTKQTLVAPAAGAEVICTETDLGTVCGWCFAYNVTVAGLPNLAILTDGCTCGPDQICISSGGAATCLTVEPADSPATQACLASEQGNIATPSGCRWALFGSGSATQVGIVGGPFDVGVRLDLLASAVPPCSFLNMEFRYVVTGVHTDDHTACADLLEAGEGTRVRYVLKDGP